MRGSGSKSEYWFVTAALIFVAAASAQAQPDPKSPPARPSVKTTVSVAEPPMPPRYRGGDDFERSIKVDPSFNLSLCVTQGTVKINGWSRNELRVYVQDGSNFGFKVQQKSLKTDDPVWIMLTGSEPRSKSLGPSECIWGSEIEIDLPMSASVNIKGQETSTIVDGVRKATVRTIGGDISIRNVTDGVIASAGQGGITVEGSTGGMELVSTTGNIVVFEAGPAEIGDIFKAKTNGGTISLQNVEHRQTEANSISGSVIFVGDLLSGGSYSFGTSNGSIRLSLPQSASCTIWASYGFGNFTSEFPVKITTENIGEGPVKSMTGRLGSGDASLKLTTNSGSIVLKKQ
ncbi:MAG: DUF4097 family beta strand repeat protein [Pyrinomonadaceae bacterium]|nr:DUF4097 family beta strand repeat protein [Pyrinomonadaceae bacterium]MBP6213697.1 DUF4097 family beta strand repeat protein [Pyrinomonadaceae bacterium]